MKQRKLQKTRILQTRVFECHNTHLQKRRLGLAAILLPQFNEVSIAARGAILRYNTNIRLGLFHAEVSFRDFFVFVFVTTSNYFNHL